jgi:hypothetical protein
MVFFGEIHTCVIKNKNCGNKIQIKDDELGDSPSEINVLIFVKF